MGHGGHHAAMSMDDMVRDMRPVPGCRSAFHPDLAGTGLGAKRGVLSKNATALKTAAHTDTVVLDKTGTLTKSWTKPEP